ncbi:MAG: PD-(D/E)XK nuclease family protein [Verrucomicrobiales bacterium]|nr:PD-(D/E)XK nuclease family protein [Verrucomicrobiales bacterium]
MKKLHEAVRSTELQKFFRTVRRMVESSESKQRCIDMFQATGFNVFKLIEPDENKLSDILADLLSPKGSHGQSDLFLRLLFQQLKFKADRKYTKKATVHREAPTHGILKFRRRMDVFIEAGALVAIENKVDSPEQVGQVNDYLDHLHLCARGRNAHTALIYLTPDGRLPKSLRATRLKKAQESGRLHCWSYREQLLTWLKACHKRCLAKRVCGFLGDFIAYIETDLQSRSMNQK